VEKYICKVLTRISCYITFTKHYNNAFYSVSTYLKMMYFNTLPPMIQNMPVYLVDCKPQKGEKSIK